MDEQEYYGFVYITTNLINGKKYIGQKKYDSKYKNYLGSGVYLKNAVKTYGKDNFERDIIERCKSPDELNEREIFWILHFDAVNNDMFYNLNYGGNQCVFGAPMSDEQRKKISESLLEYFKNNSMTEETKKKMSDSQKGKIITEETRRKIGAKKKGQTHTEETKAILSQKSLGRRHTDEAKEKIKNSGIGRIMPEEAKKKIGESNLGKKRSSEASNNMTLGQTKRFLSYESREYLRLPVNQLDLNGNFIKTWDSAKSAGIELEIKSPTHIYACCKKKRNKCGGYKWEYAEKESPIVYIIQKDLDGNMIKSWDSMLSASNELNISLEPIRSCCNKKRYTAHGFKWEYAS